MTGRRYERRLVNRLEDAGFTVVKSPSSGSGTGRDQPDLLAGAAGADRAPLAVEAKTTRDDAYTIKESEADQLERFAAAFGALPVVAMYWKGPRGGNTSYGGWWFARTDNVRRSPAENDRGGHHLRPRRENRQKWAQTSELRDGDTTMEDQND